MEEGLGKMDSELDPPDPVLVYSPENKQTPETRAVDPKCLHPKRAWTSGPVPRWHPKR